MSGGTASALDASAQRAAEVMWADDHAARNLGIQIEKIAVGHAVLSMVVTGTMVNGHGLCHGGYIFTLADTAFAYACNSHGQRTVAQHAEITFVAPGKAGMRLVAEARERHRAGRSGIYDVTVTDGTGGDGTGGDGAGADGAGADGAGATIAEFRGLSRTIAGSLT